MIKIDLQNRLPIYEQLKAQISQQILSGTLRPNDQLPSVRSFARDLGINPNTVQRAYQDLEREGLIYSVAGRGSYINPNTDILQKLIQREKQSLLFALRQAKASGVKQKEAVDAVNIVYKEDN